MKRIGCVILGIAVMLLVAGAQQPGQDRIAPASGPRFSTVDVFVDSGKEALAAWQVEFKATAGAVEIVGIERGDNKDFQDPPYYDPAAMQKSRIVVGAFNVTENLPMGKTRVARLHLQISGAQQPAYAVKLMVAGNKEGKSISATASVSESKREGDGK